MKRLIRASEDIFAMSKIVRKYANSTIRENIIDYVYFSECNSSHGPRIKFNGGTEETANTKNAPSLAFTNKGDCTLEIANWMNKKNCPNAFDNEYVESLERFVKSQRPILLLVWYKHLDEADALAYFHGQIDFNDLVDSILYDVDANIASIEALDNYCIAHELYEF